MYICHSQSPNSSHPSYTLGVHNFVLYVCISVSALLIGSSVPFCLDSTVQFSRTFVSDSLWPHGLQHARLPCPSSTLRACSNWRPPSQWCHPTISSSVITFSSHLPSFPVSGSLQMSQFIASGGQSIGLQLQHQSFQWIFGWFPLGFDLLAVQGTLKSLLQHHSSKASILRHSACFIVQLSHGYLTTRKAIALTRRTFRESLFKSWLKP